MQTSIIKQSGGLEELLNAMAPLRDVGIRKVSNTRFPDTLPKFNLSNSMNTAPARLLNDSIFSGLPLKPFASSGTTLSASSNYSGSRSSFLPIFNRTYTLEDQVRHKNFLEEAVNTFKKVEICAFCKRNGSPFYNHPLKDSRGGTVCPVLSRFTCKMCAATGRDAHTHKYCKNNPYTRGDPVAVGMAPGPSVKNPSKAAAKVDPSIDINDIYGVKKFTQFKPVKRLDNTFKPVKRLDNTRALLFDENLRINKKNQRVNGENIHKILKDNRTNGNLNPVKVDYNSNLLNTKSQNLGKSYCERIPQNFGSKYVQKSNCYSDSKSDYMVIPTNYDQKWIDLYNQGLNSSLGQTSYASIVRNSPPKNFAKLTNEIKDLPTSKRNNSKRIRRNRNKQTLELSKTAGTLSLSKELLALQRKVNKSTETLPSWF